MIKEKVFAGAETILMVASLFAFCYFVDLSGEVLPLVSAGEEDERNQRLRDFLDGFNGGTLIEDESWNSYDISSDAVGAGCCFVSENGQICGTAMPENCIEDSPFAVGALCAATSFCEKGCCYDESLGIYDKNVLEFTCPSEWVEDPNCNMPGADFGCCVLGSETIFETLGQCEVDTSTRARGEDEVVDWRGNVGEGNCLILAVLQAEGACVLGGGVCKFLSEADCFSYGGDFAEGYLCTSSSLETDCEMTVRRNVWMGKMKFILWIVVGIGRMSMIV